MRRPIVIALLIAVLTTTGVWLLVRMTSGIDDRASLDQPAPAIVGTTLDGEAFDLAALRGRPVMVNFWGPSCVPCRDEFPLLIDKAAEHAGDGLAIVGVLTDDPPEPARDFVAEYGATWPTVEDPDRSIKTAWRIAARPQTYFIDGDGVIRSIQAGWMHDEDFERQYAEDRAVTAAGDGPVIDVAGLVKRYGPRTVVDGIDLQVRAGEIVALLGPNGAGKTTTVEVIEGYRRADAGSVRVLGEDPSSAGRTWRARLGLMLQDGGFDIRARPRETLHQYAAFHADPLDPDVLLEEVGLSAAERTPYRRLSGGERQRLALAVALVGRPEVLVLDEPTAGMDPEARAVTRDRIAALRADGVAILLTSHDLVDVERLADRVVVIAAGRVVASGTTADVRGDSGDPGGRLSGARPWRAIVSGPAPWPRAATAQLSTELRLTARRGENLLAIAVIPVAVLVFFSTTTVLALPASTGVDTLLPGAIALAIIASGLVNLGIATAYERSYGVLKRLGGSPLGRSGLVAAKVGSIAVIVAIQVVVLVAVAWIGSGLAARTGRVAAGRGRRGRARDGDVRRAGAVPRRHAPRRGGPGSGQRPVPRGDAAGRHHRPDLDPAWAGRRDQ